MSVAKAQAPAPNRKRRWHQYSLRSLLALITLACLALAGWRTYTEPYRRQYTVMRQLATIDGQTPETTNAGPFRPEITTAPALPRWLRRISGSDRLVKIVSIKLDHCQVKDKDLECLRDLPDLERLYLARTGVSDEGLKNIGCCRRLRRLSLWSTQITDHSIQLLGGLPDLEALDIQDTPVTEAALVHLKGMRNLTVFRHTIPLSDEGLARLKAFPHHAGFANSRLYLRGVTDSGMEDLDVVSPALVTSLNVRRLHLEDGWRRLVATLPSLEYVVVADSVLDEQAMTALSQLPRLKNLDLQHVRVGGGWQRLSALPRLESIAMDGTPCSPDGLLALSKAHGLEKIEFQECPGVALKEIGVAWGDAVFGLDVHDEWFQCTCDGNHLGIEVHPRGASSDLAALDQFPRLTELSIEGNTPYTAGLASLERLSRLQNLSLWFPLHDEAILCAARVPSLTTLGLINPDSGRAVSAAALRHLAALNQLRELEMEGIATTDEHIAFLADLPQLHKLMMMVGNRITDAGLRHFRNLQNLEDLSMGSDQVTDDGLTNLRALKNLRILSLSCPLTDAGLRHLEGMPKLASVWVLSSRVTQAGQDRLYATLPAMRTR